jgi:hypothetical protein
MRINGEKNYKMKLTKSKLQQIIKEEIGREAQSTTFDSGYYRSLIDELAQERDALQKSFWSHLTKLQMQETKIEELEKRLSACIRSIEEAR